MPIRPLCSVGLARIGRLCDSHKIRPSLSGGSLSPPGIEASSAQEIPAAGRSAFHFRLASGGQHRKREGPRRLPGGMG